MAVGFWLALGILGLVFIPCIVLFIICGTDGTHKIVGSLFCVFFWLLFSGSIYFQDVGNAEKWNNGYCECGQHWELKGVAKTGRGGETKYYACPECYTEIEINH